MAKIKRTNNNLTQKPVNNTMAKINNTICKQYSQDKKDKLLHRNL